MSFLTKDMYRIRAVDDSPSGVPGRQVARVRACVKLSPMRHTTLVLCSGIALGVIIAPALSAQATGGRAAPPRSGSDGDPAAAPAALPAPGGWSCRQVSSRSTPG